MRRKEKVFLEMEAARYKMTGSLLEKILRFGSAPDQVKPTVSQSLREAWWETVEAFTFSTFIISFSHRNHHGASITGTRPAPV